MQSSPLVTTDWLQERLDAPGAIPGGGPVIPVDASWHLPDSGRNARREYNAAHIPGAVFYDLDALSHQAAPLPHTLQRPDLYAASVAALGISNTDTLVIYDNSDVRSAARTWWNFRIMGHRNVFVLDGGLQKWKAEGRKMTDAPTNRPAGTFTTRFVPTLCRSQDDVLMLIKNRKEQIVDARAAARFEGTAPEPRPGLKPGHIPGARNLPYSTLYAPDHTLLPKDELLTRMQAAGIDMQAPVVTSCGSGVTACVLMLAFNTLGKHDVAIYDGSWADWGSAPGLPIETGPAQ